MRPSARVAVLLTSIAAVVVLFLLLRPGAGEPAAAPSPPRAAATATLTSSPTEEPSPAESPSQSLSPDVVEIEIEVEEGRVTGRAEYTVSAGEHVRIEIRADVAGHVHVHGYDLLTGVAPGRPAVIAFRAEAPGVFEVELEEAEELLFRLRVTP